MGREFSLEDASYEGFPPPFVDVNGECDLKADYVVMQFTGLKDKNGKEIYENDLLKDEDGTVREVIWYHLGAGWRVGTDEKDTLFNGIGVYADRLEVVGNKYEN